MKKEILKKNRSLTVLLSVLAALLVLALLARLSPFLAWSSVSREHVMAAEKKLTDPASSLKPADSEHEIALFALG